MKQKHLTAVQHMLARYDDVCCAVKHLSQIPECLVITCAEECEYSMFIDMYHVPEELKEEVKISHALLTDALANALRQHQQRLGELIQDLGVELTVDDSEEEPK